MPTCGKKFPRDIGKERPCLNYHMKNCTGYCLKDASAEEYRKNIRTAAQIFEGKSDELIKTLTDEMMDDAENLRFELAAEKRDRINAITALKKKQRVVAGSAADTDAVGLYMGQAKSCFVVLHYIGGTLLDKDYEIFETPIEDREEALSGILRQYYFRRGIAAKNILLPWEIPDMEDIEQSFEQYGKAKLMVPQRGDKVRLVDPSAIRAIREAAELCGAEKLMWGSDYPRTMVEITYKMSYDFISKSKELSEAEKEMLLFKNAEAFYGFRDLKEQQFIPNML